MHKVRPLVSVARPISGQIGGFCLLWLYLVFATPLAPVVFSLLAGLDRSHRVVLQQTSLGVQVVLRHDCSESPVHRHGMLARALTVFAHRTTAPQADHVIQFRSTETALQTPVLETAPAPILPDAEGMAGDASLLYLADTSFVPAVLSRPPPAGNGLLLLVRSTVLLI